MAGAQARFRFNAEDNRASHRAGPSPARQANARTRNTRHRRTWSLPQAACPDEIPLTAAGCPVAGPLAGAISTLV